MTFDVGLTSITQADSVPNRLPSDELIPGRSPVHQELNEVLSPPTLEQSLLDSFRPHIRHPRILTPTGNQLALVEAREELQKLLPEFEGSEQSDGSQQGDAIAEAIKALDHELEMHQTLTTYRHLLHQA